MAESVDRVHALSVVVPVYRGAATLDALVRDLLPFATGGRTPGGRAFRLTEIILVHDNGPDASDEVIRGLERTHPEVRAIWLSRNFGQHAATIAGMSASVGEWIATLDEDGQHDPADLPGFLDAAIDARAGVVYGRPLNAPPHGALRNAASRGAKRLMGLVLGSKGFREYQSYRLVRGDIGRRLAEFAASGVYLDVALGWVNDRVALAPVTLRAEEERPSGYSTRTLFAHFWRMVLSSGTRGLRIVSVLGGVLALLGVALAIYLIVERLSGHVDAQGWTSLAVITLLCSGALLVSLGIVAEYIGVTLNVAMGRPLFVVVDDPSGAFEEDADEPA
ncbi:MAG TPA: glycosyltransferase [Microbacteriaceae bacterium]|nr:glycosyltransferase [Microbacteriaceae bacterium]